MKKLHDYQLTVKIFQIEIEVDRYHSIFACPILRQQSTDENPPVKLVGYFDPKEPCEHYFFAEMWTCY